MKNALWILLLVPALAACEEPKPAPPSPIPVPAPKGGTPGPAKPAGEADHIKVQHILVGFKGSLRDKPHVTRTRDEARELAMRILELAKTGLSMEELQEKYGTDDAKPGIYAMSNHGVPAAPGGYARSGMVAAFGDVGFKLGVGEVGMSEHHATSSPFGWHIIKRIE